MRVPITAIVLAVLTTACADSLPRSKERFTPAPPPPAGYATLYMFRPYAEAGDWIWPIVFSTV